MMNYRQKMIRDGKKGHPETSCFNSFDKPPPLKKTPIIILRLKV